MGVMRGGMFLWKGGRLCGMMFQPNGLGWNVRWLDWARSWQGVKLRYLFSSILTFSPAGGYLNGAVIVADGGRLQVRPSVF